MTQTLNKRVTKFERLLITKTPLAFFVQRSKHWILPGFEGVPLYDVIRFFYRQIKTHGLTDRASAISYNFIMAIPPSLLCLFTLIPNLPFISRKNLQAQIHTFISDVVPSRVYNKEILRFTDSLLFDNKIGLFSFALLFSLFFASNGMMGLIRAFNKKHHGFGKRLGIENRWMAIKLTILFFSLLLGYFILLVSQGALLKQVISNESLRNAITYTRWIWIILLLYLAFGFIFKYAPAAQKKWKINSPGTILATFISIIATIGFYAFVNNFSSYNVLYGSIGIIMVLMAVIYINSLALLIGFELNLGINSLRVQAILREENRQEASS
ncbi:MAG TPA: YihY/virulence factor BrkB family protein [Chitinophagaceae bacterium]|nr:YihY/virulence factor BrkB family protein [Chitinophagaceae bacterium]